MPLWGEGQRFSRIRGVRLEFRVQGLGFRVEDVGL